MTKIPSTDRTRPNRHRLVPTTAAAALVVGLALAGCNRADDTQAGGAVTPATPSTSTPSTPATPPASTSSPAGGNTQGQSTGTSGTGPASDSTGAASGGSSPAKADAATSGPASAPQGGEALTSTSAAGGGSGANVQGGADTGEARGGRDAKETDPQNLTGKEEKQGMPEALQSGHSHSSTALDAPQEENRKNN